MSWARIFLIVRKLISGYITGGFWNAAVVHNPAGGGIAGLIDDIIMLAVALSQEATFFESAMYAIFFGEVFKMAEQGIEAADMSERERRRLRLQLEEQHPHAVFLWGAVHTDDLLKLGVSGYYVAKSPLPEAVFQAVRSITELLPEVGEVAIVA